MLQSWESESLRGANHDLLTISGMFHPRTFNWDLVASLDIYFAQMTLSCHWPSIVELCRIETRVMDWYQGGVGGD